MSTTSTGSPFRVPPMASHHEVVYALETRSRQHPEYVRAVIRSYVKTKRSRQRGKMAIHEKLQQLERRAFADVRQEEGLPPSPVIHMKMGMATNDLRRSQTTYGGGYAGSWPQRPLMLDGQPVWGVTFRDEGRPMPGDAVARRASSVTGQSLRPSAPSVYSTSSGVTRTPSRTTHEPIPPQLAAQAEEAHDEAPPPPYARADPEPDSTRILEQRLAAETQVPGSSPTSPQPVLVHPTTGTSTSTGSGSGGADITRVPSDVELRRVWEESQLDEATRMSALAERERLDVLMAMRLSLAEAQNRGQASGSTSYGQSSSSAQFEMPADIDLPEEYARDIKRAFPPSRQTTANSTQTTAPQADLLGDDRSSNFAAGPTLVPTTATTGAASVGVAAVHAHPHVQSNNPFVHAEEVEQGLQTPTQPAQAQTLSTAHLSPSATASRHSSIRSTRDVRDSPGSSRTYTSPSGTSPGTRRALPAPPGQPNDLVSSPVQETYAPPPGPPPTLGTLGQGLAPPLPIRKGTVQPTPAAPAAPAAAAPFPARLLTREGGEDPLEMLKEYDTVFLIDDSASMAGDRWALAKAALIGVSEIAAQYDDDGIDVYFLNSKRVGKELRAAEDVEDLFAGLAPRGATPTGARMESILREYLSRLERSTASASPASTSEHIEVKPMNLIVITDGAPSDDPESVIITAAKRLDRGDYPLSQIGIQFFQIGNDTEAREALQELDDGLAATHGVRDMVDTIPFNGEMNADLIIKTLLGGINRRLDRRGS